jgi:serine protease Do
VLLAAAEVDGGGGLDSQALSAKLKAGVVQFVDDHFSGSGVIVGKEGLVITNHHVVAGMRHPQARLADGRIVDVAGLKLDDADHDLAVVQLEAGAYEALGLGDSDALQPGTPVVSEAAPLGLDWTYSEGVVAAVRPGGLPDDAIHRLQLENVGTSVLQPVLQLSLPSGAGASGGPIATRDGAVVAIVMGGMGEASSVVFAIPSKTISGVLDSARMRPLQAAVVRPWWNLGISGAFFVSLAVVFWIRSRKR